MEREVIAYPEIGFVQISLGNGLNLVLKPDEAITLEGQLNQANGEMMKYGA